MQQSRFWILVAALALALGCGGNGDGEPLVCPPGTIEVERECVPLCADGNEPVEGECPLCWDDSEPVGGECPPEPCMANATRDDAGECVCDEGFELVVSDDVLGHIVQESMRRETGARGLASILTRHLEEAAFEAFAESAGGQVVLKLDKRGEIAVKVTT